MISETKGIYMTKKKVLLRGPVLTQSGYGVHARQIAQWLLSRSDIELQIQALPWGDTPWLIDKNIHDGLVGRLLERTVDPTGMTYDATVQLQLPNEWDTSYSSVNIGITAGVETDRCNPKWVDQCNSMTMVIVPSNHARDCLMTSGNVTVPVHVIPESFSDKLIANEKTSIDDIEFSTSFNFLIFGQITGNNPENDRKNIFYTLKWLCETFQDDKDVGVVVKTNTGRNTCTDKRLVTQTLSALLKEVRKKTMPRIHLMHGDMTDSEVASLYRHKSIKALVSLTRGEGYGLPILEAAASSLPVIATSWSGHTDYLSKGKYVNIDYTLKEVHQSRIDNQIFMQGSRWAEASEEDFKKKILKFRHSSVTPREWAKDLSSKLVKEYSIEYIIKSYDEITRGLI